MPRSICVIGGKGGVGKTTTAVSLAHALNKHRKTLLVDANLSTPNVNVHLGWPILKKTLMDVINDTAKVNEAIYSHESGLRILPTVSTVEDLKRLKYSKLRQVLWDLRGEADVVVLDSAAGLNREAITTMEACDEVLIITNPELSAVLDAQKTVQVAHELGKTVLGVVVTKFRGDRHELKISEVEKLLDLPVISVIPFDEAVRKAQKSRHPVTHTHPKSKAGKSYEELAAMLLGEKYFKSTNRKSRTLYDYIMRKLGF